MNFAVFGMPRSGTTWAANWLTTGSALCLHDPIQHRGPAAVAELDIGRTFGVSCTGLWLFDDIAAHVAARCPVVILERAPADVNAALIRAGLSSLPAWMFQRFAALPGLRVPWSDLWHEAGARRIWSHLRQGEAFDVDRWRELARMRVEPVLDGLTVCESTVAAMRREFQREAGNG